jgi:hypothetical protein
MGLKDLIGKAKGIFDKIVDNNDNSEETEIEVSHENNSGEIQDIDQLENSLKNYSQALSLMENETDNKKVLVNSLKAQLEVISVAKNPSLGKSAFDLMIQSLNDAMEEIDDEKELRNIQKRAALMTNNMIFFFDAFLYYQEDRKSKQGQEYLNKACDTLATTANDIVKEIIENPAKIANMQALAFVSGKNLFKNIISQGWIQKILDFVFRAKRLEEFRNNYFDFLLTVIEKLERYKELFGRSVVLAEMINNKKEAIAEYYNPIPKGPDPESFAPVILWPTLSILAIIIILFIILGIMKLINLTPADLDNAESKLWTAIKYCGIADGAALIITSLINIFRKIAYNASVNKCLKNRDKMAYAFSQIADGFYS